MTFALYLNNAADCHKVNKIVCCMGLEITICALSILRRSRGNAKMVDSVFFSSRLDLSYNALFLFLNVTKFCKPRSEDEYKSCTKTKALKYGHY